MDPEKTITIPVSLDEKTFRRFAFFDTFILRKRWARPVIFSLILAAFAAVALLARKAQSGMIASVLLVVGLGLPVVYVGSFLNQVNLQILRQKLKPARRVYTVTLREAGITVRNDRKQEGTLELEWPALHRAYRKKGCVYLYVTPVKAFLLPDGQADAPDAEVWDYLKEHLGSEKCR